MPAMEERTDPSPCFLFVLSGSQRGARAPLLRARAYAVGTDESNDVVLCDDSIAPRHLSLTPGVNLLRIEALEQPVVLEDRVLAPGEMLERLPGLTIRLGEVCLGLGDETTDWSQAKLPDRLENRSDQTLVAVTPSADATLASGGNEPPPVTQDRSAASPLKASRRSWSLAAGLVSLPLLLIALFWWQPFAMLHADLSTSAVAISALEQARSTIDLLGVRNLELLARADGGVTLVGYCETRALKERLSATLRDAGLAVDNQLWPEDRLREVLAQTLERLGGTYLNYDYLGSGEVKLHGLLRPGFSSEQLVRTIQEDVPGISRVVTELHTLDPLLQDLRARLSAAQLDRKLLVMADKLPVTVTGRLNTEDMARWTAIHDLLAEHYTDFPTLTFDVNLESTPTRQSATEPSTPTRRSVTESASDPPVTVRGIWSGDHQAAYAILDNGEQVTIGDRIGDRYVVEEIRFDRVIVIDADQRRVFRVGKSIL